MTQAIDIIEEKKSNIWTKKNDKKYTIKKNHIKNKLKKKKQSLITNDINNK